MTLRVGKREQNKRLSQVKKQTITFSSLSDMLTLVGEESSKTIKGLKPETQQRH